MLKGLDISTWQNSSIVSAADNFVIVKATEGIGYTDPKFRQHYQTAKNAGKLLGVYHFARPDGNPSKANQEAEWFVSQVKDLVGEAILVLDWEVNTSNVGWAKTFLDRVQQLTGVKPLIYMSASVITANNWSSVAGADYGLWIAGYPAKYNVKNPPTPSVKDMPYKIGPWKAWAIWQYSSGAGTLDYDIANMDANAWQKYAAKSGSQPAPAPTPAPSPAPAPRPSTGFLPAKGYWTLGDMDRRVGREAAFLRANFPAYTPKTALGNYYGRNLFGAVKEFQRRTGLVADGSTGPITYRMLQEHGFKG